MTILIFKKLALLSRDTEDVITGWVSYEGLHLLPAFQSAISNTIFLMNSLETRYWCFGGNWDVCHCVVRYHSIPITDRNCYMGWVRMGLRG